MFSLVYTPFCKYFIINISTDMLQEKGSDEQKKWDLSLDDCFSWKHFWINFWVVIFSTCLFIDIFFNIV